MFYDNMQLPVAFFFVVVYVLMQVYVTLKNACCYLVVIRGYAMFFPSTFHVCLCTEMILLSAVNPHVSLVCERFFCSHISLLLTTVRNFVEYLETSKYGFRNSFFCQFCEYTFSVVLLVSVAPASVSALWKSRGRSFFLSHTTLTFLILFFHLTLRLSISNVFLYLPLVIPIFMLSPRSPSSLLCSTLLYSSLSLSSTIPVTSSPSTHTMLSTRILTFIHTTTAIIRAPTPSSP